MSISIRLLLCLCLGLTAPAAWSQLQFAASPVEVSGGAEARVAGSGAPLAPLRVRLRTAQGVSLAQSPQFAPDPAGNFATSVQVPANTVPGAYSLELFTTLSGAVLGATPLAVSAQLALELPAEPVALGAQFAFAVEGLRPGQLQLRIGSRSIAGPFNVVGGRFEGFALLPVDAASPGDALQIEALNRVGDQPIGFGSGRLLAATTSPLAQPRLLNLQQPGAQIAMDAPWPVSGQLVLPRRSPAGLEARLFLRLSSGRMVPLSMARAPVAADGSFSVVGDLASLHRNGIHVTPGETGDGFLVFVEPDRGQTGSGGRGDSRHVFPLGPVVVQSAGGSPDPDFTVEVLDPDGVPLRDAVVVLDIPGRWAAALGQPDAITVPATPQGGAALAGVETAPLAVGLSLASGDGSALRFGNSQVRQALAALAAPEQGTGVGGGQGCPETLARGTTNSAGRFSARIDNRHLSLLANIFAINAGLSSGNRADIVHTPVEIEFRVLINALPSGYTFSPSSTVPKGGEYRVLYRGASRRFFGWSEAANDYTVPLGENPVLSFRARSAYTGDAVYPLLVNLVDTPQLSNGLYGPLVTFPESALPPSTNLQATGLLVSVSTNEALFGAIDWMRLQRLSGEQVINSWDFNRSTQSCASTEDVRFQALINDAARQPHVFSGIRYRIVVKQLGIPTAQAFTYPFRIRTEAPPTWFASMPLEQRIVQWQPKEVRLLGQETRPQRAVSGTPQGAGTGPINNTSQAVDRYIQALTPGGLDGLQRISTSSNSGANTDGQPGSLGSSQVGVVVRWGPETILDTGTLPLFRMTWGVPPIASATFGADARFWATLEIEARSDYDYETEQLSASLTTTPTVGGNIKAFFDFSAIFGLVSMEAAFSPQFSVAMPTTITNNRFDPDLSQRCMVFRMWLEYAVSVGLCPACVEFGDAGDAFTPLREPAEPHCRVPPPPTLAPGKSTLAGLQGLRRPSVSFDSLGAGSLVEAGADGQLRERAWTGSGFGPALPLGGAVGADDVAQRHYAPGLALMVYAGSTLSESAFLASSLSQATASRRMQFRLRQGDGSWTTAALVAPGAAPVGGEGKPALAACPKGQPACPSSGEVYAVWLRGTQADPFSLATEVWGARFVNGAWQTAQRLANPGSGSDQLPRVTYLDGTPVVSFVRQPQRSLGAAGQRRLMLLRVGVDAQPVDTGAAEGVVWQDIGSNALGQLVLGYTVAIGTDALIGNQARLHAARGTCTAGGCSFNHTRQRDGFGRDIRAESPRVVRTLQGTQIAYRGLGYGPDASGQRILPGDPPGTIDGTGEFMSLVPNFQPLGASPPLSISGNGALHFNPQLFQHPVSGALVGLSNSLGIAAAGVHSLAAKLPFEPGRGVARMQQLEPDLAEFLLADGPDVALVDASSDALWAEPGDVLRLRVLIENRGPQLQGAVVLGASWGGAWDSGVPQQRFTLPAFGDSASQLVELEVPVPTELSGRGPRALHLTLDPLQRSTDIQRGNDVRVLEIGALPVPHDIRLQTAANERHALLEWAIDPDTRVRGFQVYREFAAGDWQPIGASEVAGFVDLMTEPGQTYRYRIASFDADGAESDLSAAVTVVPRSSLGVFADGFEGSAE